MLQWEGAAEIPAHGAHRLLSKSTEIIKTPALGHLLIICKEEASLTPGKSVLYLTPGTWRANVQGFVLPNIKIQAQPLPEAAHWA